MGVSEPFSKEMSPTLSQCSCKVGRMIEKYRLDSLDSEVANRRENEGQSLRDLADFVNIRILRSAIEDQTGDDFVADAAMIYDGLTGESDVGKTTELQQRLERSGVSIGTVLQDFISHQTVRSHLNDCLDIKTNRQSSTSLDEVSNLIEWSRSRDEEIINRALIRLKNEGALRMGDPNVIHSVRVICDDCGRSHRLRDLLQAGYCECKDNG